MVELSGGQGGKNNCDDGRNVGHGEGNLLFSLLLWRLLNIAARTVNIYRKGKLGQCAL